MGPIAQNSGGLQLVLWKKLAKRHKFQRDTRYGTFWVDIARKCHRQEETRVLFSWVSSSGGGLPGRPELERVPGRSLFWEQIKLVQFVEIVKFTVTFATVSTVSAPS